MNKVTLTASDSQEVAHKLWVVHDTSDLLEDYGATVEALAALITTLPRDGGEWECPQWAWKMVCEEMQNHVETLRDQASDARSENKVGVALAISRQASRLESIFTRS